MLSTTLQAVVGLRLIPRADHSGRMPAAEVLFVTASVREYLLDPEKTSLIKTAIADGVSQYGMQTFDQALLGHLQAGRIDMDEALSMATSPHDFKLMAASGGATAIDNVEESSVF
jgi:twitching motility protein PilT